MEYTPRRSSIAAVAAAAAVRTALPSVYASGAQSKQYVSGQVMQWKSCPPTFDDLRSHSMHACHGQCHVPVGTAESPTQPRWYVRGQTVHSSRSPPSPHEKQESSCLSGKRGAVDRCAALGGEKRFGAAAVRLRPERASASRAARASTAIRSRSSAAACLRCWSARQRSDTPCGSARYAAALASMPARARSLVSLEQCAWPPRSHADTWPEPTPMRRASCVWFILEVCMCFWISKSSSAWSRVVAGGFHSSSVSSAATLSSASTPSSSPPVVATASACAASRSANRVAIVDGSAR